MKLTFLGVGGAFAPISIGNSNMYFTSKSGKVLMLDFGATAPYIWRDELARSFHEIDALYVSHLHSDHIGGIEMLAFSRYFMPKKQLDGERIRPILFANHHVMKELWDCSLKGGLESIQGKVMNLGGYFDCLPLLENESFDWEFYRFTPVQTVHVVSGFIFRHSFGLMVKAHDSTHQTFITTDTQFAPNQLRDFYSQATQIFHDCETGVGFKSGVHAHYDELNTLPAETKAKLWLYHHGQTRDTVTADGFAGFVTKGQEFEV